MRSKRVLYLSVLFFVMTLSIPLQTFAQKAGSIYFGIGYSKSWFGRSKIHVEQEELGNSYNMQKVAADNKSFTSISFLQFNYHLGYFYDPRQNWGI